MSNNTILKQNFRKMDSALRNLTKEENADDLLKAYSESRHQVEDVFNGKTKNKPYQIKPIMIKTLADDLQYAIKHHTKDIRKFDQKKLDNTLIKLKKAHQAGRNWCLFDYSTYSTYNASPKQIRMIIATYNNGLQQEISKSIKQEKSKNNEWELNV